MAEGTQLSIADTAAGDEGRYTVTARNSAGRSSATTQLSVQPPPRPPKPPSLTASEPEAAVDEEGGLQRLSGDYTPFVRRGRAQTTEERGQRKTSPGSGSAVAAAEAAAALQTVRGCDEMG